MEAPPENLESWKLQILEWNQVISSIFIVWDTFLESGRSKELKGTMESPLGIWNLGIIKSWN